MSSPGEDVYSPLKVFHHQRELNQLRDGQQPVPRQVELILADLCNQDCSFCAYRAPGYTSNEEFVADAPLATYGTNNPQRWIPTEKVVEILHDCAEMGVGAIQFTGGGEPTVHPDFAKCYGLAQELGMATALNTNAVLLPKHLELAAKSAWVRVSIDAGTPETYARIRNVSPSQFNRTFVTVAELVGVKIRQKLPVIIGVGFVVTKDNWREVVECTQLVKTAGADNIRISAVLQNENEEYFREFYDEASELCRRAETFSDESFKVINMFGERVGDLKQRSPEYSFCGIQHFTTYIGGDQNVYRCCVYAYNPRGLIGSLKDQSFRELWNSQDKQDNFSGFDATGCAHCQFNIKNRTILYALNESPGHVDFV